MAVNLPLVPGSSTITTLLGKFNDDDPDFRFMALNDLITVFDTAKPDILLHEYNIAARTIDAVVKALDDQNGEVQNQAIRCLTPLVGRIPTNLIGPLIEKVTTMKLDNSVDTSIPALAIRTVVEALPRPQPGITPTKDINEAYSSVSRALLPRLLGRVPQSQKGSSILRLPAPGKGMARGEVSADVVDVIIEVIKCFGVMFNPNEEVKDLQEVILELLDNQNITSVVRKKAVLAISILAIYLTDEQLSALIERAQNVLVSTSTDFVTRRLYLTILGSLARSIPHRFGAHAGTVTQLTLSTLDEDALQAHLDEIGDGEEAGTEFAEVREAALVALDAFLASCPSEMRPYTEEVIKACLRYIKYDPNFAMDSDQDMDDEGDEDEDDEFGDDDEFETGGGFDDDDDGSWKVRKCAAKALHTLISTRSNGDLLENGVLYVQVAPFLVKRFDEREEIVRLELISAVSLLIRKTGLGLVPEFNLDGGQSPEELPVQSRKRRRQSSDVATDAAGVVSPTISKIPATGPRADLAQLTPQLVKSSVKLLKGKSIPTKQAATNLLDDLVLVQQGGLSEYLDQILHLVIDTVKTTATSASASLASSGATASATASTLRIAALKFLSDISKMHSSSLLEPYLSKMVGGVVEAVKDRYYKIAAQAIETVEEIAKAITPPRSRLTAHKFKGELLKVFDLVLDRSTAISVDAEVRQKAIHALGTILARTGDAEGNALLAESQRKQGLAVISDRLKNETSRFAAVQAVSVVTSRSSFTIDAAWVEDVAMELSVQLRKSNRNLRAASIQALKHLVAASAKQQAVNEGTKQTVVDALLPIIANNDAQLLGPSLRILASLVQVDSANSVTPKIATALCELVKLNVVAAILKPLLDLVSQIGQAGLGEALMASMLKNVGIGGDPATSGKVIGTLLVASGGTGGVDINSFVTEAETASDPARRSLALSVLGEAGLRLGPESPLKPDLFLKHFGDEFDKFSNTAAMALGRASAGHPAQYLPVVLNAFQQPKAKQYLLLHTIREVLLQNVDIGRFAVQIWDCALAASEAEDNRAVSAECIGRLAIADPDKFLTKLRKLLNDESSSARGIAVQALRSTFAEGGDKFDNVLQNNLVPMLATMLKDSDTEIRRLGMMTFTSATHNKPELVLGHLNELMPYIFSESTIKPQLVREVMMGPFKMMVDDGLELRKGAYESLYALMEVALSRISILDLFDRVIAGLSDDHDIRALSNLMLSKLAIIDSQETVRRLDTIAEAFRAVLSTKLKENAVKQEVEKQEEASRNVLRTTQLLWDKLKSSVGTGQCQIWLGYWEWVNKDYERLLMQLREESDLIGHTYA